MSYVFGERRRFRLLIVIYDCSRDRLAYVVETLIGGTRVARALGRIAEPRGKPSVMVSDNGTERTSSAILKWQAEHKMRWY